VWQTGGLIVASISQKRGVTKQIKKKILIYQEKIPNEFWTNYWFSTIMKINSEQVRPWLIADVGSVGDEIM